MVKKLLFLCLLSVGSSCALAENKKTQDPIDERTSYIIGNVEFVLLHELAHAIIDDKNVPQLAPNEVIADYIAINMAISGGQDEQAKSFLNQALIDSATSFSLSWELGNSQNLPIPYWGAHALGIQRYYAMLCLLYGSSEQEHKLLGDDLPIDRKNRCTHEYREAAEGYQWLLDNFKNEREEDQQPIEFQYGPVQSLAQDAVMKGILELGIVEKTVNSVDQLFGLSRPLKVKMHQCRYTDARWDPTRRELIICYELLNAFAQFFAHKQVKDEEAQSDH